MAEKDVYIIKTKFGQSFDFIHIEENELSFENFVQNAIKIFKVKGDGDFKVMLKDCNNISLTQANFNKIIKYYAHCACFHVKLQLDPELMPSTFVTPDSIENYLIEHNADQALLAEREQLPTGLPKSIRCSLINHLGDYLISLYGLTTVKKEQMLQFCKEVIVLFPSLSLKNGDDSDTDLLCDSNSGGFLANRIKYLRAQHRKSLNACASATVSESEVFEEIPASCEEDVELLKITVVNEQNMDAIKFKLAATSEYRRQMIRDNHSIDLLEKFPYFFTNHKLVEFEFNIIYKSIDPNSFVNNWQSYATKLRNLMKVEYKNQMFVTKWPSEIEDFFMLLKLIPWKPNGKNGAASAATFRDSIEKLIVFSNKDGLPDMVEKNDHPYIIACGQSQKELTHYYVDIEKHLINVPKHFTVVEAFDFYFKLHKIFNLNFDPILRNAMVFVQHYVYKIEEKKPSTGMLEIFNKIK